jgi:hypothetical protein
MVLLILGIAIIISIYLLIVAPDNYSDWGEEYMDEEFKKRKSK